MNSEYRDTAIQTIMFKLMDKKMITILRQKIAYLALWRKCTHWSYTYIFDLPFLKFHEGSEKNRIYLVLSFLKMN